MNEFGHLLRVYIVGAHIDAAIYKEQLTTSLYKANRTAKNYIGGLIYAIINCCNRGTVTTYFHHEI